MTAMAFAHCLLPVRHASGRLNSRSVSLSRPPTIGWRRSAPRHRGKKLSLCASAAPPEAQSTGNVSQGRPQAPDPFALSRGDIVCPAAAWKSCGAEGTWKIADSHGVDMPNLSRSYGMILAKQMLDLGIDDLIPECVIDGIHFGWKDLESPMDVAHFETLMQSLLPDSNADTPPRSKPKKTVGEMYAMSQMYGFLLGTTLRMSCLELDVSLVEKGFRAKCGEPDLHLPLEDAEYDRMFMEVQQIAGALMYEANQKDAGRFFQSARVADDVSKVDAEGNVLVLHGQRKSSEAERAATVKDIVIVVLAGRLLDGRAFLVPTFSQGLDQEADSVRIPLEGVPESLSAGIVGMRVGEVRTLYIHPDASEGVSALFSAQPFPPQSVIIFDVKLLAIEPEGEQSATASESADS